jgi:hypothetical protein
MTERLPHFGFQPPAICRAMEVFGYEEGIDFIEIKPVPTNADVSLWLRSVTAAPRNREGER